jgi:phosphomannomutase/phosphoglucomutase
MKETIFREYDIRGVYPQDLNGDIAYKISVAYSKYLKSKTNKKSLWVSVGMDVRKSSPEIQQGVIDGLLDSQINVIDLGLVPTPLLYFSLFTPIIDDNFVDGGIMITASHNPAEFNGMKLCVGQWALYGNQIKEIYKIATTQKFNKSSLKGKIVSYDIKLPYIYYMVGQFSSLKNMYKNFVQPKIAIDCGNGTAGIVVSKILDMLGIKYYKLYFDPDGNFPNHHPDPTVPNNIKDLIKLVKEKKLWCGIGYDGDSDRLGLVDGLGEPVWGDKLLLLASKYILENNKGAKIIGEVKCSQVLFDGIKKFGGKPIIYRTGHSLIKEKMKQENALLAGEMSGHMFFNDRYFGFDDAIYSSLRFLEIIGKEQKSLDKIISFIPKMFNTPEIRVDCPDEKKFKVVEELKKEIKLLKYNFLDIDGVRIQFSDGGFGLVRASNTQPALVMRFEAKTEKLLNQHKDFVMSLVKKLM